MIASNDIPPTDEELNRFYGVPPTAYEIADSLRRQAQAYDFGDLAETCFANSSSILAALADNNPQALFDIFHADMTKTIKRRSDIELYGRVL